MRNHYTLPFARQPNNSHDRRRLRKQPEHIPKLIQQTAKFDIVVASRTKLPRISEKIASKTLGKLLGVTDTLSNFRVFRKEAVPIFNLRGGETFGAEFLVTAKKKASP